MKILRFLDKHIEEILLVFLLSSTSILTVVQVIARYIIDSPLSWSEELSRYMFIWMIYIGVSYGVKRDSHIKIDVLMDLFPKSMRKGILIISSLIFMAFSLFIVFTGFQVSTKIFQLGQKSPAVGMEMGFVYLAPVVGFSLAFIRLIQKFLTSLGKEDEIIELSNGGGN